MGRPFRGRARGGHARDKCLDPVRQAVVASGSRRIAGACRDARQDRYRRSGGCRRDFRRARHRRRALPGERRRRGYGPRRHSHAERGTARRGDRPGRGAAAHRPVAQRSGRDRFPVVGARCDRSGRCGAEGLPARAARARRGTCRQRDARLHPSAKRAAGHARPLPDGVFRDDRARPQPLCRRTRARQPQPAWLGGACPAPASRSTAT